MGFVGTPVFQKVLFQSHEWLFRIQKIISGKKNQLRQHGNYFELFSWQPRDKKTEFFLVTGKKTQFSCLLDGR